MSELGDIIGKLKGLSLLSKLSLADIDDSIEETKRGIDMLEEELSTLQVLRNVKVVMENRASVYHGVIDTQPSPEPEPEPRAHKPAYQEIQEAWGEKEVRTLAEFVELLPHRPRATISQALVQRKDLFCRVGRGEYVLKAKHTDREIEYLLSERENNVRTKTSSTASEGSSQSSELAGCQLEND